MLYNAVLVVVELRRDNRNGNRIICAQDHGYPPQQPRLTEMKGPGAGGHVKAQSLAAEILTYLPVSQRTLVCFAADSQ